MQNPISGAHEHSGADHFLSYSEAEARLFEATPENKPSKKRATILSYKRIRQAHYAPLSHRNGELTRPKKAPVILITVCTAFPF
jgi:hypothetical protein